MSTIQEEDENIFGKDDEEIIDNEETETLEEEKKEEVVSKKEFLKRVNKLTAEKGILQQKLQALQGKEIAKEETEEEKEEVIVEPAAKIAEMEKRQAALELQINLGVLTKSLEKAQQDYPGVDMHEVLLEMKEKGLKIAMVDTIARAKYAELLKVEVDTLKKGITNKQGETEGSTRKAKLEGTKVAKDFDEATKMAKEKYGK